MSRLGWNEYPVMAAVAALAGILLFLLLQTVGGAPAGEQPLRRAEPASSVVTNPPTPSQVEAARQERVRDRAAAKRQARVRARRAAAAAAAAPAPRVVEPSDSFGAESTQPYRDELQSQGTQRAAPVPDPQPQPKPAPRQEQTPPGRNFDDSG